MKKYLLASLVSLLVLPISANLVCNYKNVNKEETYKNFLKQNNLNKSLNSNDNSGYDWNNIQNLFSDKIKNNWITKNFSNSEITNITNLSQTKISSFQNSNSTSQNAYQNFLETSPKFNDLYNNNQDAFSDITEKINAQFFSSQKVDLQLDASNTYSDAINNLNILINSTYPGNNIVVSLANKNLANKYLFDDSTSNKLLQFINNKISISVNVQFGDSKPENKVINLTNIQINPQTEDAWLYECVNSYFNKLNPQDLNLTATDTRTVALAKIINLINQRFNINISSKDSHSGINIILQNPDASNENFLQSDNIQYVMNQNMYFDVKIADYNDSIVKTSKQSLYLVNINFNENNMIKVINSLWLNNNSQNNPVNLGLMSNQTYGDVVNNFNQRLENLNQKNHFQVNLTDPSLENVKIDHDYNPENNIFKANLDFSYIKNNQIQNLGSCDIYLSNVKLSNSDSKINLKYENLITLMNKLNKLETALTAVSLVASILGVTSVFYEPLQSSFLTYFALISSAAALGLGGYLAAIGEEVSSQDLIADIFTTVSLIVSSIIILLTTFLVSSEADGEVLVIADAFFSVVSLVTGIVADAKDWI